MASQTTVPADVEEPLLPKPKQSSRKYMVVGVAAALALGALALTAASKASSNGTMEMAQGMVEVCRVYGSDLKSRFSRHLRGQCNRDGVEVDDFTHVLISTGLRQRWYEGRDVLYCRLG